MSLGGCGSVTPVGSDGGTGTVGTSLSLYIATDGSTFYDAALTQPARLRP